MSQINLNNKIHYPQEILMSHMIDNSMIKIKELTEAILGTEEGNIKDALEEARELEEIAVKYVIDGYDIH